MPKAPVFTGAFCFPTLHPLTPQFMAWGPCGLPPEMNPKTTKCPACVTVNKSLTRPQGAPHPASGHLLPSAEKGSDVMLSKKELAPKLGVSVRTIENWQHKRYLPFLKIDNVVIFHWPTVLAHLLTHFSVAPCGGPPVRAARALKTEI